MKVTTTVVGLMVIARNGDRMHFYQDPYDYSASFTSTTALGEVQSHKLGQGIREQYFNPSSPSFIPGMSSDLVDNRKIAAHVKAGYEGDVVFDSSIALLQGLFPPTKSNQLVLANDTVVVAPLGGYQYVPVETVEPANDRSLESWTRCPAFQKHIAGFYSSQDFKDKASEARTFLDRISHFIFGRPATMENMWNIHDFVRTELVYNKTFAYRLPPTYAKQARHWANYHENGIFSDAKMDGIGNIAGRTLLSTILRSMERISFNHNPLQFMLIETSYHPFISLFHLTEAVKANPSLAAIPDYAASLVIELRRSSPPDVRDFLKFKFKNGTEDETYHDLTIFGHNQPEGIALTEFIYRTKGAAIKGYDEWYDACHSSPGIFGVTTYDPAMNVAAISLIAFLLVLAIRSVVKYRKRRAGYVYLPDESKAAFASSSGMLYEAVYSYPVDRKTTV